MKFKRKIMSLFLTFVIIFGMLPSLAFAGTQYTVEFIVSDANGTIKGAEITIDSVTETTDSDGKATFSLENGDYSYAVSALGRVEKTDGSITISNGNVTENVTLSIDPNGATINITSHSDSNLENEIASFMSVHSLTSSMATGLSVSGGMITLNDFTALNLSTIKTGLKTVDLSETSLYKNMVDSGMFINCTDLSKVVLPDSITDIGESAFSGCTGLKSITLPANVTTIGGGAFSSSGLTSITLPSNVTTIGAVAFRYCTSLKSITFSSNVTSIGDATFEGCTGLTSIALPPNLTNIGANAFMDCTGLTSVTIPSNVTSIGDSAFNGCTGLTSISILSSGASIGIKTFYECRNLVDVTIDSAEPPTTASTSFLNVSSGAVVHVPSGSASAYRAANDNNQTDNYWYGLYIDDPDMAPTLSNGWSLRTSDEEVIVGCTLDILATYYYAIVNDGDAQPVIDTTGQGTVTNYAAIEIPITTLTAGAKDLYVVAKNGDKLSNTLKIDIDAYVEPFDIVISSHEAGTLEQEIEAYLDSHNCSGAYIGIRSLKVIGGSLNAVDQDYIKGTTWDWYNLETIDFSGTSFEYMEANDNVMSDQLFVSFKACSTVILPESISNISNLAFRECYNLKNITLPSSITSIGAGAFAYCESLEMIAIPSGVTSIGAGAFYYCTSLSKITINSSTPPNVEEQVFNNLPSGAQVYVPHGSGAAYKAAQDGDTTDSLWYGLSIVEASDTTGSSHSSGSSSSGTSSTSDSSKTVVSGSIAVATASTSATSDKTGNASATFTTSQVDNAISKAVAAAAKEGEDTTAQVKFEVTAPSDASSVKTTLPVSAVNLASNSQVSSITVATPIASIAFDRSTALALSGQTSSDVTVTASKVNLESLSDELQLAVGEHPVYDFSVTAGGQSITKFDGNVTVTVPYSPKDGEDVNCIIMYYINSDGEAEAVTNSVYDSVTGTISFTTNHFSRYAVGYKEVSFNDVSENVWYRDAVAFASARNITSGTGSGNFSPNATLTRGQFLVMAMRAYGLSSDQNSTDNFADAGNTYYTGYLATAKRLGISTGVGENLFKPDSNITRQEVFNLLYNMLKTLDSLPDGSLEKTQADFEDGDKIASWAQDAMALFIETGILNGSDGKLNAEGVSNRAELVQILYNLLLLEQ